MIKVLISQGYDSYNNKQLTRAFLEPEKAVQFLEDLTDTKTMVLTSTSYIELLNTFLKGDIKL